MARSMGFQYLGRSVRIAFVDEVTKISDMVIDAMWVNRRSSCWRRSGLRPIMLGTETDGSLVQPSTRAALYGLKLTLATMGTYGVLSLSKSFDSIR